MSASTMSESTYTVSGCKGTKKKCNLVVIEMENFCKICLYFRNLAVFECKNGISYNVFDATSLKYRKKCVSLHGNCEKRITK